MKISFKKKHILIVVGAAVLTAALLLLLLPQKPDQTPGNTDIIVPWNPGGMADMVIRAATAGQGFSVRNLPGANGADGLNEAYSGTLLGTNISALVTSDYMGFTTHGHANWDIRLVAYAPTVVAVSAASPYATLEELVEAGRMSGLVSANSGRGTLGFVSAYLFAEAAGLEVRQASFSGINPAVNAVIAGEADFITALSSELIAGLRSGELRALAVFAKEGLAPDGVGYEITPAGEVVPGLAGLFPFGEFYGIMLPRGSGLEGYDEALEAGTGSEAYAAFLRENGLCAAPEQDVAARMQSVLCWALYDTGCVSRSPGEIGVSRLP